MRELHPLGKITFPYQQPNVVTDPATGGGGALGYYGSFYDTTSQTIASTTTAYAIAINTTSEYNGVTIVGGTKITFAHAGTYNIQFSAQLASADTSIHDASIWIRKNGVDVPYSTGMIAVPNSHAGIDGKIIASWNYVITLAAGDYIEFWWQGESTNLYIAAIAAGTTPTSPITPSVIVTAQQVMNTQIGASTFITLTDVPSSYSGQTGKYLRVNSGETGLEFATVSGGGGNATTAILDFGVDDYSASTVVTGQTWVTSSSSIIATFIDYAGNNSAEDAAVEGLTATIGDYVAGTGFTVYVSSPFGSVGKYKVACVGV